MSALWELGSGTVAEVNEHLDAGLAYTTVLTILRNLESKRFVRREEEGRGHRYFPRVPQEAARRNALSRLVSQLFDGSPHALLAQLVDEHGVTPDELQRLAQGLNEKPAAKSDAKSARKGRRSGGEK